MAIRRKKSLITQAAEFAESVLPTLESAYGAAKDAAGPLLSDAKDKAAPLLADGKSLAAEKASAGKDRAVEAAAAGRVKAAEAMATAAQMAKDKAPEPLSAEPPSKRRRWFKRLLLVGALAAIGTVVFKKVRGEDPADNWQSSYVPAPPPPAPAAPDAAAPTDSDEGAEVDAAEADDAAGSSPDEALADAAEEPHPVTTPDAPADVVELDPEAEKQPADPS